MRHEVIVRLAGSDELMLDTTDPMSFEAARSWLDQEFSRLEATPLRATGKILFSDKLLAVAQAAGAKGFADASWAAQFARAAAGVLDKTLIRVDVPDATVGY
jgi:hypothetical protein